MQGLWLGSWKGRIDKPLDLDWKSTSVRVLGVYIGNIDTGAANFEEQYAAIRAKIRMWKPRPLSEIGKIRVANMFLYSRLWYRTEVMTPWRGRARRDGVLDGGYAQVEREVEGFVFRGRMEIAGARLRDGYDLGGAQLVDIGD